MTVETLTPLAADALAGLWSTPPVLPTKWLYDERGSRLFDEITRLPEYYPTRRETASCATTPTTSSMPRTRR